MLAPCDTDYSWLQQLSRPWPPPPPARSRRRPTPRTELQPLFTYLKLAQAGSHLPAFLPSLPAASRLPIWGAAAIQRGHCCHRWLYQKLLYFLYKGLYSDVALSRCIAPIQRCIVYSYTALYSIQPIHPPSGELAFTLTVRDGALETSL